MHPLFEASYRRARGARSTVPQPTIAIVKGKVRAWAGTRHLRSLSIPDLSVVVLAKKMGAVAVLDDKVALKAAEDLNVVSATSRELIAALVSQGTVESAEPILRRIVATGYHPHERVHNRWSAK